MDRTLVRFAALALALMLAHPRVCRAGADLAFSADRVVSDLESGVLRATGSVELVAPNLLVRASELWLFVPDDGERGLLLDGAELRLVLEDRVLVAEAGLVSVQAGVVTLEEGRASLCACGPAPVGVSFGMLQAEAGGDILVRRGWLELCGRRVLPLPWLLLRTGRKVGLLPPRIGYASRRGLLVGLGAVLPLPRLWDLVVHADWLALDGLGLGAGLETPSVRLDSSFVLDPVDRGLASGWIAGALQASSGLQHAGLVLDTPLVARTALGDMPSVQGAAGRYALQTLGVRLAPLGGWLSILGEVGLVRELAIGAGQGGGRVLEASGTWMRSPSLVLALQPVRVLGPAVPLLLDARIRYDRLAPLAGAVGPGLDHAGVGLGLTGRWLPGRVLDLGIHAGWHGALLRAVDGTQPDLWLQEARGGAQASLSFLGPTSPSGLAHRLDLVLAYRASYREVTGPWWGAGAALVPDPVPTHLTGLVLRNALVRVRAEVLAVSAGAWLVPRAGRPPAGLVSLGLELRAGPLRLDVHLDLPVEGWRPSLARTVLSLAAPGFSLEVGHLYLAGGAVTSLALDAWRSTLRGPGLRAGPGEGLDTAMLGLVLPLGGGVALEARAGLDVERRAGSWFEASVTYAHPCRCLEVGLLVLGRAGVPAPDVVLAIGL